MKRLFLASVVASGLFLGACATEPMMPEAPKLPSYSATLAPGARIELPWRADFNALAYALSGSGHVGAAGQPISGGQLAVLGKGDHITLEAATSQSVATPSLEVLLLGGTPLREPVFAYGPFVMNTRAEVVQAIEDYQAGRLGVVPDGAIMPHRG